MKYHYVEYNFSVEPLQPVTDILIAELSQVGFESFLETKNGLQAYILVENEDRDQVKRLSIMQNSDFTIFYKRRSIPPKNWNETWEKQFNPIEIDGRCYIRASFHPAKPEFEYEIIINPKMSFGTGHHRTTHLMVEQIMRHEMTGKSVLDIGCGTAVLAILAKMRGATFVKAVDTDEWAFRNALENVEKNNVTIEISLIEGTLLTDETFDIILANINSNILLENAEQYVNALKSGGTLFLSGFYNNDLPLIQNGFEKHGVIFVNDLQRNDWVSAQFKKI